MGQCLRENWNKYTEVCSSNLWSCVFTSLVHGSQNGRRNRECFNFKYVCQFDTNDKGLREVYNILTWPSQPAQLWISDSIYKHCNFKMAYFYHWKDSEKTLPISAPSRTTSLLRRVYYSSTVSDLTAIKIHDTWNLFPVVEINKFSAFPIKSCSHRPQSSASKAGSDFSESDRSFLGEVSNCL